MDHANPPATEEFLSQVADGLEAEANRLESANGSASYNGSAKARPHFDAQFGSKLVYTACYTFSYGVCFPVFMVCRYIPKKNQFVTGLVDGGKAASSSVDDVLAGKWHLSGQSNESSEVAAAGAEALASA